MQKCKLFFCSVVKCKRRKIVQFEIRLYLHVDTFIYNSKSDFVFSHCHVELD